MMIGRTLSHFRITAKLGEGGMGEVYRAEDTNLDREVALKVLPEEFTRVPDRLARFEREAKLLAALNHPNIVTIYSVEQVDDVHFLTMELVEGEPLSRLIPTDGLPQERIFDIAIPLIDALAAAHKKGVIHRDLKPANLMVTDDGRVKILDFGLAKALDSPAAPDLSQSPTMTAGLTGAHVVLGTLPYMSPEQLEGKAVDARSDIFALGAILFEMATGRRPFLGDTSVSLTSAIMKDTPDDVDALRSDLPHHLARIIRHCLEKDPGDRFQTARDVRNELRDLRRETESGVTRPRIAVPPRGAGPANRARWLGAVAALVLIAVATLWLVARKDPPPEAARTVRSELPRIVVLPFENLGRPEDAYFADGLTEEITSRLSSVQGLGVISRTSAIQYADDRPSLGQIGEELDVEYVLEGTVRWDRPTEGPSRLRITPQLIRVADDTHLWSDSYDRTLEDIFAVQSDLAQQVLRALDVALFQQQKGRFDTPPTQNLDAYQAYLRGRYLEERPHFSLGPANQALASYQRAVNLDADFALAWGRLARMHSNLFYFKVDASEDRRSLARQAVERAVELAPDDPQTHLTLGLFHLKAERNPEAALRELEIAEAGLPQDRDVFMTKGELARLQGRMEDAAREYQAAADVSPLDSSPLVEIGITYGLGMRRYPEALAALDRAIELAPGETWPYLTKAWVYWLWKGALPEARAALEATSPDHPWVPWFWFWQEIYEGRFRQAIDRLDTDAGEWVRLKMWARPKALLRAFAHQLLDEPQLARAAFEHAATQLEEALPANADDPRYHSSLGIAYAALGRKEEAIREGKRAIELFPLSRDAAYALPHPQDLAHIYVLTGDYQSAIEELDHLLSIPGWVSIPWLELDPRWAPLRDDPGYE